MKTTPKLLSRPPNGPLKSDAWYLRVVGAPRCLAATLHEVRCALPAVQDGRCRVHRRGED